MPSTLDLCEEYFGTRDIYKLLDLTKDSLEKDVKKAYYRLSLKVHPDRVPESEKEISTEKFKILAKIHQVLSDKNKKALYDEQGIIDDDDDESKLASWLDIWRQIFKPISMKDIDDFKNEYLGSDLEKTDIKKTYLNGKGCINYMMNSVPFMSVEDEPRIKKIVLDMIEAGEVPEYTIFTNEPKSKTDRRHKKYAKEKVEAEKIKKNLEKKMGNGGNLEQQIMKKQKERAESFLSKLMDKYGGEDDSEVFTLEELGKRAKPKKATPRKAKVATVTKKNPTRKTPRKQNPETPTKPKERKVKSGRVTKR